MIFEMTQYMFDVFPDHIFIFITTTIDTFFRLFSQLIFRTCKEAPCISEPLFKSRMQD
jgi:hypothetical protein